MNSRQLTYIFSILFLTVIFSSSFYLLNENEESRYLELQLDTPELSIDNADSNIGEWIVPAIMKGEGIDNKFIEENVYISQFHLTAGKEVIRISFSITYNIENQHIVKYYQIRDHGLVFIVSETGCKSSYEQLLPVVSFIEIFKAVNKNTIKDLFGIEHGITFAEIVSISRLEAVEIGKEELVVLNNQFIKFGEVPQDSHFLICYIAFAGEGGGSSLPFLISMN